ncbi:MAG TPA: LptA/OstA family protein [Candidatus Sulfotelmatobacter sp.]|nr:LptA/OstA family protein [Candidatus Sulfotelmatobacter sp.]
MPLKVYRLRRLLAVTAVLLTMVVAGMYFYARRKATNVLKQFPGKIGYDIKQTASGFQFSKSDGKRTLFTVQASAVKQFKLNGNAELHNVSIVVYGRDSSRFDQIYGDDFAFNQKTGDVTAKGDVQIDLVSNPAGLASPDQTTPKELKNPIHLKTHDLVFNKDSGNAMTAARVEFQTPQATGWAVGVQYAGKTNALTLSSQIHVVLNGAYAAVIEADHGIITNDPREITLYRPHLTRQDGTVQADQAVFYLSHENHVERILASGNVTTETRMQGAKESSPKQESAPDANPQPSQVRSRADQAEFLLEGKQDLLRAATLSGSVHLDQTGPQSLQGEAGRVVLDFSGKNELQKVHALEGVRLTQKATTAINPSAKSRASGPQDFELVAPEIDFMVAQGHILRRAVTSGAARIAIAQAQPASPLTPASAQHTDVTAGRFEAQFAFTEGRNHLVSIHGAPEARIVNSTPGEPERISTSDAVDATFLPEGGLDSVTQQGNVVYTDGQDPAKRTQAWAKSARYTPADQMLILTGSPRVTNGGMATTATTIRINRATGDAFAQEDVKSTYSELKEQPNGALLASSSPIHVTARSMTAHNSPGTALYTGNARLWQDANLIEAPTIQFDRDRRSVIAVGTPYQPVQTVLLQAAKADEREKASTGRPKQDSISRSTPISVTAAKLTYADSERRIRYEGGVVAQSADFTASAKTVDAYLLPRSQATNNQTVAGPGQLDRMVAQDNVVIQQPKRRAEGQKLVYTATDDKFVLTGGPPSIFDAEHGKITGVSLTFFRRDDRVLVEGGASTPVVTQTRVAQ